MASLHGQHRTLQADRRNLEDEFARLTTERRRMSSGIADLLTAVRSIHDRLTTFSHQQQQQHHGDDEDENVRKDDGQVD